MTSDVTQSTPAVRRAATILRKAGWVVIAPTRAQSKGSGDQCEYPDRHGEPGDCCINSTKRKRTTSRGWLWLCSMHFDAPESELVDERVAHVTP